LGLSSSGETACGIHSLPGETATLFSILPLAVFQSACDKNLGYMWPPVKLHFSKNLGFLERCPFWGKMEEEEFVAFQITMILALLATFPPVGQEAG
jgi:hypothetical protein